jgi:16S rRNA (guanine1516-N2)-methyltransferase
MRDLKDIVGEDLDADELFRACLGRAKKRIVVKRPRHAEHINQQQPSFSYDGKSSRFDIYLM